jgi:hypothetical protein
MSTSTAGPSRPALAVSPRVPKISNFLPVDSDDELDGAEKPAVQDRDVKTTSKKRKLQNAAASGSKKKLVKPDEEDVAARRQRREVAERLMEVRQDLPFYQGGSESREELMRRP